MKENTGAINAQVPVDVATFLLNEKRVDLQLIEARHRVSIMLIPNVHLETPNYSVTRMRHDDLNKTEPLPPSYNLVEAPTEEQKPAAGTAEPTAPRPEAAVKVIAPQQPAPVPVARETRQEPASKAPAPAAQASIIDKIFGLFRSKPGVPGPAPEVAQPPVSQGPRRGRHERGEREGPRRDREDRGMQQGGQRPRQPQAQQPQGPRDGSRHRGEQQRHEQRRQEPHRHEQQARPNPQRDQAPSEVRPESHPQQPGREHGEQQREGRGRRRRRGRDRYEQRQQEGGGAGRGQQGNRSEGERPASVARDAAVAPIAAAALAGVAAPAAAGPELKPQASAYESEAVREFEPRAPEAPQPVPSGPGYAPAEPVRIEWPSDLVQVESDPDKLQSVQPQDSEQQPAPRPRRVRPPAQPVTEEPLVQIETGQAGGPPADSEVPIRG
jgi:ribonuclease E